MTDWNPNDTGTLGPEWFPHRTGKLDLGTKSYAAAMSLVQSAAQQISYLSVYVTDVDVPVQSDARYPQPGIWAVEVFDDETAVVDPTTVTYLTARPNEDVAGTGSSAGQWRENTGTTTTIFSEIDDTTETEWIHNAEGGGPGVNTAYYGRVNTGSLTLTNRRILGVRLRARVGRAFVDNFTAIILGLNISSSDYFSPPFILPMWDIRTIEYLWSYNPATKRPWTIADVQAFDTSDEFSVVPFSFFGAGNVTVFWLEMEVVTCPETRLALGGLYGLSASDGNKHKLSGAGTQTLITPAGGAWTKDGSGRHLYVVRRMSDAGSLALPTMDAAPDAPPSTGPTMWVPALEPTYGYVTEMGDSQTRLFSLGQYRSTSVFSVDSQPYSVLTDGLVYSGQDAEQEVSGAAAADYGVIRFLVKPGDATAALDVKVKKRSDNTQLGTTFTLLPGDVLEATSLGGAAFVEKDDGWFLATLQLATAATLASATQYYIEFSSSTASGAPWTVGVLESRESADSGTTIVGLGTYNDATDRALANGSELDKYDVATTISTVPAAPTDFESAIGHQDLGASTVCGTTSIPRVELSWTGSATMDQQLERSVDGQPYERIANLAANGTTSYSFNDYEGAFHHQLYYQVRQVRSDGAVSGTSTAISTDAETLGQTYIIKRPGDCCPAVYFVSNYAPGNNTAIDYAPGKRLEFLDAPEVAFHAIYGRDGQLGAQPIEDRGVRYSISVIVATTANVGVTYGATGVNAFDVIRGTARAALPYLCVLDHYGSKIYATVVVPTGGMDEPGGLFTADLIAVTAQTTPYVVEA